MLSLLCVYLFLDPLNPLPNQLTPHTRARHCPLFLVLLLVSQEADSVAEAARTMRTGEWSLLGCMDPSMALKPGSGSKSLATDVAAVALGVRVGPAVVLQRQQVGQKFGTQGTRVQSSGMGLLVIQQATSMTVRTPTLSTAKGAFLVFSCCEIYSLSSISWLPVLFWVSRKS